MSRVNEPLNPPEAHVLQPWVAHLAPMGLAASFFCCRPLVVCPPTRP